MAKPVVQSELDDIRRAEEELDKELGFNQNDNDIPAPKPLKATTKPGEPTVRIMLQVLEEDTDSEGSKTDQTVPVIINGKATIIKRGEYVDIPASLFIVMKQSRRFPGL